MKKTIVIISNLNGALVLFRKELIQELIRDYRIIVVSDSSGPERDQALKEMGCQMIETKVDRRGINPATDLKLYRRYKAILKKYKPELVITYTIKPNIYAGAACRSLKIPYVSNITGLGTAFEKGNLMRLMVKKLYKGALKKAKTVFFENSANAGLFVDEKIIKKDQACILPGAGINLGRFSYLDYPSDENGFVFLFIGRIMKEKGIDELFQSMEKLHSENTGVVLHILGEMEDNYKDAIQKAVDAGWLKYFGYQMDVRKYIENAHCIVLPSWHEGMANTNLEAASSGRPIIVSNIPGCKEAVIDGNTGLLCKVKDPDDLYLKMKQMTETSWDDRRKMGISGREHMEKVFDKDVVVKKTIEHLYL